jgi:hypothetical protein
METFCSAAEATATVCTALDPRHRRRSPRHHRPLGAAMTPIDRATNAVPRHDTAPRIPLQQRGIELSRRSRSPEARLHFVECTDKHVYMVSAMPDGSTDVRDYSFVRK